MLMVAEDFVRLHNDCMKNTIAEEVARGGRDLVTCSTGGATELHGAIKKIHKVEFQPTGDTHKFWLISASETYVLQRLSVKDAHGPEVVVEDAEDEESDEYILQQCAVMMQLHYATFLDSSSEISIDPSGVPQFTPGEFPQMPALSSMQGSHMLCYVCGEMIETSVWLSHARACKGGVSPLQDTESYMFPIIHAACFGPVFPPV